MRLSILLAGAVAASLAAASPAAARTLVVDDDTSCRDARHASIQAAVDAARSGDTVQVCPGTYREYVTVPGTLASLKLISRTRHAAVIEAPAEPSAVRDGIVELYARAALLRGFTIRGTLPAADDGQGCEPSAAVYVVAGINLPGTANVTVDHNRIHDVECSVPGRGTSGIVTDRLDPVRLTVAHNDISGYTDVGVGLDLAQANVHDNRIDGSGGPDTLGVYVNEWSGGTTVASNDIVDNGRTGILAFGFEHPEFVVDITGNRLLRNGTGIEVSSIGSGVGRDPRMSRVVRNRVLESREYGIFAETLFTLFRGNVALGSGATDCVGLRIDTQIWQDNIGVTSDEPGLCRAP